MNKPWKYITPIAVIAAVIIIIVFEVNYNKPTKAPEGKVEKSIDEIKPVEKPVEDKALVPPVVVIPDEIKNIKEEDLKQDDVIPARLDSTDTGINETVAVKPEPAVKTYTTPYFDVNYPSSEWEYAEGKSMNIPTFIDIPRHTAISTVEFCSKTNSDNMIFLHISMSGGANFNSMERDDIINYVRYIYNDIRLSNISIKRINSLKFAYLSFTPANNDKILVQQYLTAENDILYTITFSELKSKPIGEDFINSVLGSLKIYVDKKTD